MTVYEQSKKGHESDDIPAAAAFPQHPSPITGTILTNLTKSGFTAVNAAPLSLNPQLESESDRDSEDDAVVAADLGGSQPLPSAPEPKRHKTESRSKRKDLKEMSKDQGKEKHKDKKIRRKSEKVDS
jgi:hypothetical protein